jgi:hypothetical protein
VTTSSGVCHQGYVLMTFFYDHNSLPMPYVSIIPLHLTDKVIEYSEQKLWHAVFTNDHTELKVYDHRKKPLIVVRPPKIMSTWTICP